MTHKKIAELANVSLSTVSKALSGSREINEELRKKIIKIATQGGYFAEKSKRKIDYASDNSITVAVVCPEIISIAYAAEIHALKTELEVKGATVAVYAYDFDAEKLDGIIENITVGNRADGIILFQSYSGEIEPSIPTVVIGIPCKNCDTLFCDIDTYFSDIVGYLKSLGHKRIAFVGETFTAIKYTSFKNALKAHGIPFDVRDAYIVNERFEAIGYVAADEMIKNGNLPTAAVCAYDEIALALIKRLTEVGIRVPEDISVVGINDIPMSAYSLIPLTSVHVFEKEQAEIAVKLLYDKIFRRSKVIQHITIRHELIKRNSTDKAKKEN